MAIGGIAVEPEQQGRGIGSRLIAGAIEEATRRGAEKLTPHVLGTNAAAIALYRSHGFRVAEVRSGAFLVAGTLVDDLVMERGLHRPEGVTRIEGFSRSWPMEAWSWTSSLATVIVLGLIVPVIGRVALAPKAEPGQWVTTRRRPPSKDSAFSSRP